jgi:hypothetical protein
VQSFLGIYVIKRAKSDFSELSIWDLDNPIGSWLGCFVRETKKLEKGGNYE